jgi:hypothetical protein
MREIVASFQQSNSVVVKDIHAKLLARQARLYATPVHVPLRLGKRSIRLERIEQQPSSAASVQSDGHLIQFAVRARDDLGKLDEDILVQWLGEDRPRIITSVKILDTTRHINGFVTSMGKKDIPLAKGITSVSMNEILETWESLMQLLSQLD